GHAGVGCASAAASGGDCGAGAAGAFVGAMGNNFFATGNVAGDFGVATVSGGLGSMAAGGKFADGAKIAAVGYLFNHCMHNVCSWNHLQQQVVDVWSQTYIKFAEAGVSVLSLFVAPELAGARAAAGFFEG